MRLKELNPSGGRSHVSDSDEASVKVVEGAGRTCPVELGIDRGSPFPRHILVLDRINYMEAYMNQREFKMVIISELGGLESTVNHYLDRGWRVHTVLVTNDRKLVEGRADHRTHIT